LSASELGSYNHTLVQTPNRVEAVSDPAFLDRCTIRVEAHPGDVDKNQTDRAEITGTSVRWRAGENVWYLLSFMLGRLNPTPPPHGWMLIHQFFGAWLLQNELPGVLVVEAVLVGLDGAITECCGRRRGERRRTFPVD
jgi:hypothetical protein